MASDGEAILMIFMTNTDLANHILIVTTLKKIGMASVHYFDCIIVLQTSDNGVGNAVNNRPRILSIVAQKHIHYKLCLFLRLTRI